MREIADDAAKKEPMVIILRLFRTSAFNATIRSIDRCRDEDNESLSSLGGER